MATVIWFIDAPKNDTAGGYLMYKEHDVDVEAVYTSNSAFYLGFKCQKNWFFPLDLISDHYEAYSYHSYLKFKLPTTASGTLTKAELIIRLGNAGMIMNVNPIYMDIDIYHREVYNASEFPWATLNDDDYPSGSWHNDGTKIENFYQMWADFLVDGPHWLPAVEVTTGVAEAISNGWEWAAFLLTPNYSTPLDWDYDERPTAYNQEMWLGFFGAVNPYWVDKPDSDYPYTSAPACPWLKLTYSGGTTQYVPGEDVTEAGEGSAIKCVAADPKAQMAIIGCESGSLWYTWSGGRQYSKMYEADSSITAVYTDHVRNFLDYPGDEISWFGTVSGKLYRSLNSLSTFSLMTTFGGSIVEIRGSHLTSDKVVVGINGSDGTHGYIYTTVNGGTSWRLAKTANAPFTGMFVRGDEIQTVFSGAVSRSPNWGVTWYDMIGDSSTFIDVGFDILNNQNIVVGGSDGQLYIFSGAVGEAYHLKPGATVSGIVTQIDTDWESQVAVIATNARLYKTTSWGSDVLELLNQPIIDVAIGGNALAIYELPDVSGYALMPNGDYSVSWSCCIDSVGCGQPGPAYSYIDDDGTDDRYLHSIDGPPWSDWHNAIFYHETLVASGYDVEFIVNKVCHRDPGGGASMRWIIRYGGTNYYHSAGTSSESYASVINPATSTKWTVASFNSALLGFSEMSSSVPYGYMHLDSFTFRAFVKKSEFLMMGSAPVNRGGGLGKTFVNTADPSDMNGYVNYVEFYVQNTCNVSIGTCYQVSTNHYTVRDYRSLGSFAPGLHKIYVALEVKVGDFLTISGNISISTSFNTGNVSTSTSAIPYTNELFVANSYVASFIGVGYR